MPSLSDRKEIAKKLRSKFACGLGITPGSIAYVLGYTAPKGATYDDAVRELFGLLADLIDPTCKPVEADNNIVCSGCGADLYDDDLYCSRCGARVVRDE